MSFATSDCIVFLAALNQIIEGMKSQSVWFWKEHYHAAIMFKWIKGLLVSKAPCPQSLSTACSKGGFACRVWVEWIVIDSVKGNSVSWSVNVYHLVLSLDNKLTEFETTSILNCHCCSRSNLLPVSPQSRLGLGLVYVHVMVVYLLTSQYKILGMGNRQISRLPCEHRWSKLITVEHSIIREGKVPHLPEFSRRIAGILLVGERQIRNSGAA